MYLFYYVTYSSTEGVFWVIDQVSINQGPVTQLCLTLHAPMDCSPPGSSVHELLQARIVMWVAISYFRESSWPRNLGLLYCRQILYCLNYQGNFSQTLGDNAGRSSTSKKIKCISGVHTTAPFRLEASPIHMTCCQGISWSSCEAVPHQELNISFSC